MYLSFQSRPIKLFLPSLVFLCFCAAGTAQDKPRRFEIFLQGGVSFFNEKTGPSQEAIFDPVTNSVQIVPTTVQTSLRQTARLFVGIRFFFTPYDAMEGSFSYSPSDLFRLRLDQNPNFVTPAFAVRDQVLDIYSYNYVRYFRKEGRWRPFVTGGIGLSYFLNSPATGHSVAWNFGGGTDVMVSKRIAFRIEYRDFIVEVPDFESVGRFHNQVPSAGLVFRF